MRYGIALQLWATELRDEHVPLIGQLRSLGYDGVEVPIFDLRPEVWRPWRTRFESLGLGVTAGTACFEDANPLSPDRAARVSAAERLRRAIDCCAEVGAEVLAGPFHSALGVFSGAGPTEQEWERAAEHLRAGAQYADACGVTLAIEFLNRFECYLVNTAEDAARLVQRVDHPRCRIHYDTFHAHIEERDVGVAIRRAGPLIGYVHVSENDRGVPGRGAVAWDATFRALADIGYDGWLTIEAFGTTLPQLAAATRIWRRVFASDMELAAEGIAFLRGAVGRQRWATALGT